MTSTTLAAIYADIATEEALEIEAARERRDHGLRR